MYCIYISPIRSKSLSFGTSLSSRRKLSFAALSRARDTLAQPGNMWSVPCAVTITHFGRTGRINSPAAANFSPRFAATQSPVLPKAELAVQPRHEMQHWRR